MCGLKSLVSTIASERNTKERERWSDGRNTEKYQEGEKGVLIFYKAA